AHPAIVHALPRLSQEAVRRRDVARGQAGTAVRGFRARRNLARLKDVPAHRRRATSRPRRPATALRIGTSGYVYASGRRRFSPAGLPTRAWLAYYATHFDTVELNGTFYRLPEAPVFARWRTQVPAGFTFAVKFSRFGTHMKRLLGARETIGRFAQPARRLGPPPGPIRVQLPPP